nr:XRE family transcriptional regulator [uncultured Campylobacter sp.]
MDKNEFQSLLNKAGINKKRLSELSGIPYATVNAWGSRTPYPPYLKFMLENYIKSLDMDKIVEVVKPYVDKDL